MMRPTPPRARSAKYAARRLMSRARSSRPVCMEPMITRLRSVVDPRSNGHSRFRYGSVTWPPQGSRDLAAPGQRLGDPAGQLAAARAGHAVDLLVRPGLLFDHVDVHPAVVLHGAQRPVDLLVRGGPEVTDGAVEPAGQLVSGAGLLAQRH